MPVPAFRATQWIIKFQKSDEKRYSFVIHCRAKVQRQAVLRGSSSVIPAILGLSYARRHMELNILYNENGINGILYANFILKRSFIISLALFCLNNCALSMKIESQCGR
jgi:hypothetical protein